MTASKCIPSSATAARGTIASALLPSSGAAANPGRQCRMIFPTPCRHPAPCGTACDVKLGDERHAMVQLGTLARLAVLIVPGNRGSFRRQAEELFSQLLCLVSHQATPLVATTMMVFLRDGADKSACLEIMRSRFGESLPVTTFAVQPPCCGAALGVELWALGGPGVKVRRYSSHLLAVESDGVRWIHCGDIRGAGGPNAPYAESLSAFRQMQQQLALAGVGFDQVVRTWIYVNRITSGPDGDQRYQKFNGARADFYRDIQFGRKARSSGALHRIYPASTGIGTRGTNITMACLALDSPRSDVFLLPLENPQQTAAYDYHAKYSPQSPRFSRAMAVVQGHFIATLVSGTASIVNAQTCHPGDIVRQTEQTIENIERLIAPENFERHGLAGAGATLNDIAKLRVYVKNHEDYEKCREVCEKRLPRAPSIYLQADVCRPDLLVEIEAVAFSPFGDGCDPAKTLAGNSI